MIEIPFTIAPHEKALSHIYAYINKHYKKDNQRWRLVKSERATAGKVSITAKLVIEQFDGTSYNLLNESPEFTVAENDSIDNIAYNKATIKILYFCLSALGHTPEWRFKTEDVKALKKLYTPETTWEKDLEDNGIKIGDLIVMKESLEDIKKYIGTRTNGKYPVQALIDAAKKAAGNKKRISGAQLLKFVYGSKPYRFFSQQFSKRPAVRVAAPAPVKEAKIEPSAYSREAGEIIRLTKQFEALGVGKRNYKDKLSKWSGAYPTLSLFLANSTPSELAEALASLS